MDFFAEQDRARRSTRRLLLLFALAVFSLIALTNLALAVVMWASQDAPAGTEVYRDSVSARFLDYLSMPLFLGIGAAVSAAVAIASGIKHVQLARGGSVVAQMLGGTALDPASHEPAERRLLNVVEEMAIASGIPVPPVYRVPGAGINAFAAGFAPADAVVGLTDGALARLGRDELQGVIGHEFSHIQNGDMRLNLRLIAVLHGIQFIAQAGRLLLDSERGSGSRDKSAGPVLALGLALMLIGSVGVFFGRLIKAGVSREREFLADASAVQFTRNPLGLADALRRIAELAEHGGVASPRVEEASHLFFAQAIAVRASSLFATHPPLETRIRRLDPAWTGRLDASVPPGAAAEGDQRVGIADIATVMPASAGGLSDALHIVDAQADGGESSLGVTAGPAASAQAGGAVPAPLGGLSGALRAACRGADTAAGAVLGALIDPRTEVARRQYELLAGEGFAMPPGLEVELAHAPLLPVLELARPALAAQDEGERARLWSAIERLIALDGHLDVRELSAAVMLERHLCPQTGLARATRARYRRLEQVAGSLVVLYSSLACSAPGNGEARFAAAQSATGLEGLRLLHAPAPDWPALRKALAVLRGVYPLLKPRVLKGCRAALQSGRRDDPDASTLLGLLAGVLDCPARIVNES